MDLFFFCDVSKGFKKEYSSFEEGNICEFVKVCVFLVLLKSIQSGDGTSLLAMSWFTGTILNLNQGLIYNLVLRNLIILFCFSENYL